MNPMDWFAIGCFVAAAGGSALVAFLAWLEE